MPLSYEFAVIVHVFAAVVWVGGVLFIGAIAIPASRSLPEEQRRKTISLLTRPFRIVGWIALLTLLGTGLYLIWIWGARPGNLVDGTFFDTPRAWILGVKIALVTLMILVSGLHDWYIGPKAAELAEEQNENARPWRIAAGLLGGLTGLLSLCIVLCAIVIARPWMTFWL